MLEGVQARANLRECGINEPATIRELEGREVWCDIGDLFNFVRCDAGTIVESQFLEIGLKEKRESIVIKRPIPRNNLTNLKVRKPSWFQYLVHVDGSNIPKHLNIMNMLRNNLSSA